MLIADQGMHTDRYTVIPRTLTFLTRSGEVLLLRGAPDKALWAGFLNGIGGHVEPGEDIAAAAQREVREETGLAAPTLDLRALVHVTGMQGCPGVLLFVYTGQAPPGEVTASTEGRLEWHALDALPFDEMVEDLPFLLPRILAPGAARNIVYCLYTADADGRVVFQFSSPT